MYFFLFNYGESKFLIYCIDLLYEVQAVCIKLIIFISYMTIVFVSFFLSNEDKKQVLFNKDISLVALL